MLLRRIIFILLLSFLALPAITYSNSFDNYLRTHCVRGCVDSSNILRSSMEVANDLDLDFKMLLAISRVESGFRPKAKNGSSRGLMQVHLKWHRDKFKSKDYYDVKDNIRVGAIVYRECLKRRKGNTRKALRCYNGGGDKNYVQKVMKAYNQIVKLDTFKDIDKDPLGSFINMLKLS